MTWGGNLLNAAYNVATAPARLAVAGAVAGVKAEVWMVEQEVKATQWLAKQEVKALVATEHAAVAAAKAIGNAAVATAKAIGNAAVTAVKATYAGVKWLFQGVWQSFTGGPKGFVNIPCMIAAKVQSILLDRPYAEFQDRQVRVCTDSSGNQTFEEVARIDSGPDEGKYAVLGTVTPPVTNKESVPATTTWETKWATPEYAVVPAPNVSHVNGINNTPAEGLVGAAALQRQLQTRCKDRSPAGGGCSGCNCVLFTYSEKLTATSDILQCIAAKAGWDGKVTKTEEQMMRDAIAQHRHLTMSAHSRGSILTENAWRRVRDEQIAKHLADPAVQAAGRAAYDDALASGSDDMGARASADETMHGLARQRAAADMNDNVTVVSAGNAVAFYDPDEKGVRVISTWHGQPVDLINRYTGSGGVRSLLVPVPFVSKWLALTSGVGLLDNMRTVPSEVTHDFSIPNHFFPKYYAAQVANQICHPGAKPLGPDRNALPSQEGSAPAGAKGAP
jgi:hypothetical protein